MNNKYNILYSLVQIMLFLAFFDGIRGNLIIGPYITIFKAVISFFAAVYVFLTYHERLRIDAGIKIFYAFLAFVFFISFLDAMDVGVWWGIRFFAQYFLLIMFIYTFQPLVYTGYFTRDQILTTVVRIGVVFVLATWFFYFVELPIWSHFHPWWGRISQGYPTCEVFMISVSLAIVLFFNSLATPPRTTLQ